MATSRFAYSLAWGKEVSTSDELDDCPNNGWRGVLPGKLSPSDGFPALRRTVKLVATLAPPIPGVDVYFRVFDVDDPFDQVHGPNGSATEIANVGLIDSTPVVGNDNRDTSTTLGFFGPVPSQPDGTASITLTVSMQPGDNYRAAASVIRAAVRDPSQSGQLDQSDADDLSVKTNLAGKLVGNGSFGAYKVPVVWSQMLTVWRKLHVETDTMARPTFAENTINTQWNDPRWVLGDLILDVLDQDDDDNFENGYIRIKADGHTDLVTRIITFRHSILDDEVTTSIEEAEWGTRPDSGDCTLSDDDLAEENLFTAGVLGSDIGIGNLPGGHLPLPDTAELARHYRPAYILPTIEDGHTSLGTNAFVKNIQNVESEAAWTPVLPNRTLSGPATDYWTVYVYSAFQAEDSEDYDIETTATKGINTHFEGIIFGVPPYSGFGAQYTGMCGVFVESLDDGFGEFEHRITVAHEIAHTLGIDHGTGLMGKTEQTDDFSAESLNELRDYDGP